MDRGEVATGSSTQRGASWLEHVRQLRALAPKSVCVAAFSNRPAGAEARVLRHQRTHHRHVVGHAPKQVQAMKDGLARLAAQGIKAIED